MYFWSISMSKIPLPVQEPLIHPLNNYITLASSSPLMNFEGSSSFQCSWADLYIIFLSFLKAQGAKWQSQKACMFHNGTRTVKCPSQTMGCHSDSENPYTASFQSLKSLYFIHFEDQWATAKPTSRLNSFNYFYYCFRLQFHRSSGIPCPPPQFLSPQLTSPLVLPWVVFMNSPKSIMLLLKRFLTL